MKAIYLGGLSKHVDYVMHEDPRHHEGHYIGRVAGHDNLMQWLEERLSLESEPDRQYQTNEQVDSKIEQNSH